MMRRIALLQEHTHHPTPHEYDYRAALMGQLLAHAGISMADCFLGYGDDPALPTKLAAYAPHFIVLWEQHGSLLRLFGTQRRKLDDWAGYVWLTEACVPGVKCLATYAPGRIRVEMGLTGTVRFHLARVAREAATDGLVVPRRDILWNATKEQILFQLRGMREDKRPLAIDIEGGCGMGPACIGFAPSEQEALVVPFYNVDSVSLWSEEDELELWEAVAGVLEDPTVPKIIQNALYELFVLAWTTGIVVRGLQDDTMLKHFELLCELDKALEFQATLYTNQPYWKLEHRQVEGRYVPFKNSRRATTEEWLIYNGTDCCVTYECNEVMEARLKPQQREHYRFNMDLLVPLCYMSLRGIRYDHALARERLAETQTRIYELQDQINQEAARSPDRPALRQFYEALGQTCALPVERHASEERALHDDKQQQPDLQSRPSTHQQSLPVAEQREQCVVCVEGGLPEVDDHGGTTTTLVGDCSSGSRRAGLHGEGEPARGDAGAPTPQATTQALIPLLTTAFCCCERDRRERVEVVETRWQPMRRNAKGKWVKAGKLLDDGAAPSLYIIKAIEETGLNSQWTEATEPPQPVGAWLKPVRRTVSKLVPVEVATLEDVRRFCLGTRQEACKRVVAILRASGVQGTGLGAAQRGELATLLGVGVKLNATGRGKDKQAEDGSTVRGSERDANWLLYEWWKLPKQFKKDGVRLTDKLSSDAESVIKAYLKSGKDDATRDQRALTFLKWRWHDTQRETLEAECDADGRIRCGYNLVGTETHRLSCYESPTGSGFNLQTVTKGLRDLFLADEGCVLCQRDLSGADGWTVAAYAALLGDRTMLEDYRAKLKPAQIIVLMLDQGAGVNRLSRDELRPLCKPITEEADWRYFAMKRVQHGSSYMMGKGTTSDQILTDSFKKDGKPVFLAPKDCERIQQTCFFVRYPGIKRLHEWMSRELKEKGVLTASNGFSRRFFGRKDDAATQRQALAHLPQVYTTYATTLALSQLWKDPTNRREDGSLRVEPLHTVHDSLLTQWREEDTPYAKEGMVRWFANEMRIAGELITIPASGTYGRSWGEQSETL